MWWRIILTGAACLLVAGCIATGGVTLYHKSPWSTATSASLDFALICVAVKYILDATKTANELRKLGKDTKKTDLETLKLELEIADKRKTAEKEAARVTLATIEEIKEYGSPLPPRTKTSSSNLYIAGIVSVLLTFAIHAIAFSHLQHSELMANKKQTPPPSVLNKQSGASNSDTSESQVTSPQKRDNTLKSVRREPNTEEAKTEVKRKPGADEALQAHSAAAAPASPLPPEEILVRKNFIELDARADSVRDSLSTMRSQQKAQGYDLRGEVIVSLKIMNDELSLANSALVNHDLVNAEVHMDKAREELDKLEKFLGR
jgi:hypothetical protein